MHKIILISIFGFFALLSGVQGEPADCSHLASYVCDPSHNFAVIEPLQLRAKWESTPQDKRFNKEKFKEFEVAFKVHIIKRAVVFLELYKKEISLRPETTQDTLHLLDQMIQKVEETRLEFDPSQGIAAEAGRSFRDSVIQIGAIHWIGKDIDPSTSLTLLHEVGHLVINAVFQKDDSMQALPYDKNNPFDSVFQILKGVVKSADLKCAESLNEKLALAKRVNSFSEAIENIHKNPYFEESFITDFGICSPNQFNEGFADWFAGRVLKTTDNEGHIRTSPLPEQELLSSFAKLCIYKAEREQGIKNDPNSLASRAYGFTSHPDYITRIEKIYLGAAGLKDSLLSCQPLKL